MIPIKGPGYAVEVHRRLRAAGTDVSLAMFGDGELRTRLEQEAPEVRFHGSLDFATEWCPTVASSVDLMVLPHLQSDPAGTYLESAGMGVPVIGFDNVALDHLVEVAGLGWTSPPRRADLLARRIEQLMATPDELLRAGNAGREFMTDHCFEKDFDARVQHLHDVLRSGVQ
jgi:glycosyltransferase involved in cell wall biosynthesis